ncbi:MAG: enoyl-CoA hydratase/isomerase family protein [Burkholderiaceae bacterium]
MNTASRLVTTERHGAVLCIRLTSPHNRNSLTLELREQIGDAVREAERDASIRSVLMTADGPTFCSGGDLHHIKRACDPWTVHRRIRDLSSWFAPLLALEKPVVVAMQGPAVGGGMGLALAGDLVIAAESAEFVVGFFRLGVLPDLGVLHFLPRLIGMARTRNFLFGSAGRLSAREAQDWGLVARVVPDDALFDSAMQEAQRLATGPAEVMGLTKSLLARSFETGRADMLSIEGLGQALAMSSAEFREGLDAALDKRRADFAGAAARSRAST